MGKFVTLVIGCVLVIGLLMFGGADMLRQLNAPQLADAQARIAEANARIAEAQARIVEEQASAQMENLEEVLNFLSVPVALVLCAVIAAAAFWAGMRAAERFVGMRGQ